MTTLIFYFHVLYTYSRVVGTWDVRNKFLKCVSVRPALPSEERHIPAFVEASNTVMKEITSVTSEL